MTKPISRKMAVDCLLFTFSTRGYLDGRAARIVCTICGRCLETGQNIQFDHIHAYVFDGPHEFMNLRPVHAECHKEKTARDIKDNAKVKRIRGERKPKFKRKIPSRKMQSRPFPKRKRASAF